MMDGIFVKSHFSKESIPSARQVIRTRFGATSGKRGDEHGLGDVRRGVEQGTPFDP